MRTSAMRTSIVRSAAARRNLRRGVRDYVRDRNGATALEYGLIVMCIFLAIVVAVTLVGNDTSDAFNNVANSMDNAIQ